MEQTGLCGENSFMWLSTVTAGRLLRAFKFHEMRRIPWLTETMTMELQHLTRMATRKTSPGPDPHSYSVNTLNPSGN
jgi:hypothetical protein